MINLKGIWKQGFAFDKHVISSKYICDNEYGYPVFETQRSEMGGLLYKLKYGQIPAIIQDIVYILKKSAEFDSFIKGIDYIAPVPPSNKARLVQPVIAVAQELSNTFGKPLLMDFIQSTNTDQIKNTDVSERIEKVKNNLLIKNNINKNAKIMLFDDLFDSGSTMTAITEKLKENGYENISIFTLTQGKDAN
ncbi:MAG: hypothetical protein LBL46_00330 [Rickettsiales bacterium]|jgi:predicted amidophosphoribosyltransferase|nr:hypothetical protein [Rickettsiales bacterium]